MKSLRQVFGTFILFFVLLGPAHHAFSATGSGINVEQQLKCSQSASSEQNILCLTKIISASTSSTNDIVWALLFRANTYAVMNEPDKSAADFKAVLTTAPKNKPTMVERGNLLTTVGQFDLAIQAYDEVIALNPKDLVALKARAVTQLQRQNFRSAISDFSRIIEIEPKNVNALLYRGIIRSDLRQNEAAISDLTQAIRLSPTRDFLAYSSRANAYYAKGNFLTAVRDYSTALEINPNSPEAHLNRGSILQFQGKHNTALKDFDALLKFDPEKFGAYAHNGRCWSLIFLKQLDAAMTECNESIRLNNQISETYDSRALIFEKLGKLDLAEADYQMSLKLKPSNTYAIDGLARVIAAKNK